MHLGANPFHPGSSLNNPNPFMSTNPLHSTTPFQSHPSQNGFHNTNYQRAVDPYAETQAYGNGNSYGNKNGGKVDREFFSTLDKRAISKQLLSQVHFCRFLFKIIAGIQSGINVRVSHQMKDMLTTLLFFKLKETKELQLLKKDMVEEYRSFSDYKKLEKLVEDYHYKYTRKLQTGPNPACSALESSDIYCSTSS